MKRPKKNVRTLKVHILKLEDGSENFMVVENDKSQKSRAIQLKPCFQTQSKTHLQKKSAFMICQSEGSAVGCGNKSSCSKRHHSYASRSCFPRVHNHRKSSRQSSPTSSEDQNEKHPHAPRRRPRRRCASASCVANSSRRRGSKTPDKGECAQCSCKGKRRKNHDESTCVAREDKAIKRSSPRRRHTHYPEDKERPLSVLSLVSLNRNPSLAKTEKKVTFAEKCSYIPDVRECKSKVASFNSRQDVVRKSSPYKLFNHSLSSGEDSCSSEEITGRMSLDRSDCDLQDVFYDAEDGNRSDKARSPTRNTSSREAQPSSMQDWRTKRRSVTPNPSDTVKRVHRSRNIQQYKTPSKGTKCRKSGNGYDKPSAVHRKPRVSKNTQYVEPSNLQKEPRGSRKSHSEGTYEPVKERLPNGEPSALQRDLRVHRNYHFDKPSDLKNEPRVSRKSQFERTYEQSNESVPSGESSDLQKELRVNKKSQFGKSSDLQNEPRVSKKCQYQRSERVPNGELSALQKELRATRTSQFGGVPAALEREARVSSTLPKTTRFHRHSQYVRTFERLKKHLPSNLEDREVSPLGIRHRVPRDRNIGSTETVSMMTVLRVPADIEYTETPAIKRYRSYLEKRHHSKVT